MNHNQSFTELDLRVTRLQKIWLRLITYVYWVGSISIVLLISLIVLFTSNDMGHGVLSFFLSAIIFGLLWYPMQLIKEAIPDMVFAPQPKYDFQTPAPFMPFSEEREPESPLERGYYPQMSQTQIQ